MSETVQTYEDIVSIDKRIQALNQEVTHINKIIKHYNEYKECLSENPDQTFLEYIILKKESFSEERTMLISKRNKIIEKYQDKEFD